MPVTITRTAPRDAMKHYAALVARNSALAHDTANAPAKNALAIQAANFFRDELRPSLQDLQDMPLSEALLAADNAPADLGTLSGTLVLQEALEGFAYEYPMLGAVWTDMSAEPGVFQQTQMTRVPVAASVQAYNPALDAAGRPKGWDTTSPHLTVDVPITLDEYIGVPIVFGQNTIGGTTRNLFKEAAPLAMNALGGRLVDKLTALCTAANFNAYSVNSFTGGATTSGSATITMTSTAGLFPGAIISGTGIPAGALVGKIVDGTTALINTAATATGAALTFSIANSVPDIFVTYAKARADFNMASLDEISAAFDENKVPQQGRSVLLNSAYYARLRNDPTINTFFAAMVDREIITKGNLPELVGFVPTKAPYFPKTNNRVGFACHRAALVLKTRLPQDFTRMASVAVPGSVTTVIGPMGMSLSLVQYIDLRGNYVEWRPEIMIGAAVGDRRGGLVLTSQ